MIFTDRERTDTLPSGYAEPQFSYLDKSARPEAEKVRHVLEDWISRYPESGRDELCNRLRLNDDVHFLSAAFELYLHELLLKLGYSVQIHPPVTSSQKDTRPDFLVSYPGCPDIYIEAVQASGLSEAARGSEARKNVVYDAINQLDSPNFFVGIKLRSTSVNPLPVRKIRAELAKWLIQLDPDEQIQIIREKGLSSTSKSFCKDGWQLEFFPIPKSQGKRGQPCVRPIGMHFAGFKPVTSQEDIRNSIAKKASHYGELGRPYVIAVNTLSQYVDETDIMEALFGDESYILSFPDDEFENEQPEMRRKLNGAWTSYQGPKHTRVSGVMVIANLAPWSIASKEIRLYHNPWAQFPCEGLVCQLPQYIPIEDRMVLKGGMHPREIFGLPVGWPED